MCRFIEVSQEKNWRILREHSNSDNPSGSCDLPKTQSSYYCSWIDVGTGNDVPSLPAFFKNCSGTRANNTRGCQRHVTGRSILIDIDSTMRLFAAHSDMANVKVVYILLRETIFLCFLWIFSWWLSIEFIMLFIISFIASKVEFIDEDEAVLNIA